MKASNSRAKNSTESTPRVKRLKVAEACNECRNRKIKCDGRQPGESTDDKEVPATAWNYSIPPAKMSIESRLKTITGLPTPDSCPFRPLNNIGLIGSLACGPCRSRFGSISDTPCGYKGMSDQISHPSNVNTSTGSEKEQMADMESGSSERNNHDQQTNTEHRVPWNNDNDETTSAILGAVYPESAQQGFYGGSSIGSFMEQVRKAIEGKLKSPENMESSSPDSLQRQTGLNMFFPRPKKPDNLHNLDYSLPSRRAADNLMAIYWTNLYPLYPFLDPAQFMARYKDLWTGKQNIADDESTYICTLNAIFALACQYDKHNALEEREKAAEKFFRRAKSSLNVWEASSLGSVQAYLLLGQYLQSTNEPHQCWTMVGLAVRTAQSIGLHLPETGERMSSLALRELIRKVWHGCVLMDRTTAMTYGRPVMVHKSIAGSVPLPISSENASSIQSEAPRPTLPQKVESETSGLCFFIESLKLFRILYEVLIRFYSSDPHQPLNVSVMSEYLLGRLNAPDQNRTILAIDRDLSNWRRSLPAFLKNLPSTEHVDNILYRQAIVIHQRFLHVRILNLRPILSTFVSLEWSSPTADVADQDEDTSFFGNALIFRIGLQCSVICVQNAIEAIHVVHQHLNNASEWWYNIMYLYTAATIIIAARLQPLILADVSEDAIDQAWREAVTTLKKYELYGKVVRRLLATIQLLAQQIPMSYMQYHKRQRDRPTATDVDTDGMRNEIHSNYVDSSVIPAAADNHELIAHESIPYSGINIPVDTAESSLQGERDLFNEFNNFTDFTFDPNDISWLIDIPLEF